MPSLPIPTYTIRGCHLGCSRYVSTGNGSQGQWAFDWFIKCIDLFHSRGGLAPSKSDCSVPPSMVRHQYLLPECVHTYMSAIQVVWIGGHVFITWEQCYTLDHIASMQYLIRYICLYCRLLPVVIVLGPFLALGATTDIIEDASNCSCWYAKYFELIVCTLQFHSQTMD